MDDQPAVPRKRRRWPWFASVLVLTHLVIGAGIYISQYEPLENAYTIGHPGATGKEVGAFVDPGLFILDYEDEEVFGIAFVLANRGPLPVTVTGVKIFAEDEPDLVFPVEALDVLMGPTGSLDLDIRDAEPFEPFRLGGDGHRPLIVRGRFDDCEHHVAEEGIAFGFHEATVTYRVLGIPREARVPLLTRFELPLTADTCPPA